MGLSNVNDNISDRGVFVAPQFCGVGTGQHMYINAFEGLDVSWVGESSFCVLMFYPLGASHD